MFDYINNFICNTLIKFGFINDFSYLYGKTCNFCNKSIVLDETSRDNIYFYDIYGLGKHDKRTICHKCMVKKFNKN
jgi:hypothetical protein